MAFETVPVVHLENGRFPEYPGKDVDPVLTELARRFGRVALVDAQGVRRNDADLELVQAVSRRRPLWVDAGSRYATDAMDLFIAGAQAVTMRWNTLASPEELEEAATLCEPETLFVGVELPHRTFLPHPKDPRGIDEVARLASRLGIGVVYIVDGAGEDVLGRLPTSGATRYVQGAAVRAERLEELGFHGQLVAPDRLPEETR